MKLCNCLRSSASFRLEIALAIKGRSYDRVPVHLLKGKAETVARWIDSVALPAFDRAQPWNGPAASA